MTTDYDEPGGNLSSDTRHLDGQDPEWVRVVRRWTDIWEEVPFPSIGVDEEEAKAKSQLYDQLHYDAFKAEFPTWDFRHFECTRQPHITDSVILELWAEDEDSPTYMVHLEASEDAPFWLITTFDPASFDTERVIYTNSGVEEA